jgi:hopanoid biosynthesis associated protein HpnK
MKQVIVNGDDFGLAVPVNEAIIEAHRRGVLTTASLMVGAEAATDAVERAKRLPSLRIGLHVVLVEGRSILPPQIIPDLVDCQGEFSDHPARAGFRYACGRNIRRQLEAEIRAQFEAFRQTGLVLDHVDTHNHLHLHPRILNLILEVGRDYGLAAMRLPNEPPFFSWRATVKFPAGRLAAWLALFPLIGFMKRRLRRSSVRCNDFIFGMADTGAMTEDVVLRCLRNLPSGVTEIYFHPSTRRCAEIDRTMPAYRHVEEFETLVSDRIRAAFEATGASRIAFSDL